MEIPVGFVSAAVGISLPEGSTTLLPRAMAQDFVFHPSRAPIRAGSQPQAAALHTLQINL